MWSVLRKNKELYPVTASVVFGCVLAAAYLVRMATQHPDAAWANKRSQFPWQSVKPQEQKRFYSSFDYSKIKDTKPEID